MSKRFCVDYLGCKVNSYEVNAIKEALENRGHFYDGTNRCQTGPYGTSDYSHRCNSFSFIFNR